MNIDENTAVTPESVSEQSADVQAQDSTVSALEEFMADTEETTEDVQEVTEEPAETQTEQPTDTMPEEMPKGIKGRIMKAEANADKRGYARAQSEWAVEKAEYERRIAEYEAEKAEQLLERDATDLSKKEHISVEIAKRLLRAERGIKAPVVQEKPVETSKTEQQNVLSDERRNQLNGQVASIKSKYGIDVMSLVTDADAQAIFNGTMDLWEVAMRSVTANKPVQDAPKPVKSGGNSSPVKGGMDFSTMTDEEFERFNDKISRGARYIPK